MSDSFQKTNPVWEIQRLGRQVSEWVDLQLNQLSQSRSTTETPDWSLPPEIWRIVFWMMIYLLIAWAVWQVVRLLQPYIAALRVQQSREQRRSPSTPPPPLSEWVRRAQEYQRQGNYVQACRALYMAMLQRLDDTQQLPQQPSRTDGEYEFAVQPLSKSRSYEQLLKTHEQLCFGDDSQISAEVFQRCQQAYREIETK